MITLRSFLIALGSAFVGSGATYAAVTAAQDRDAVAARRKIAALSYNVASGGGVNRKMMPDPVTGKPTVALDEVFTFDRNHAICRVDTNPLAFKMPTNSMGDVVIEPGKFFMGMATTT